VAACFSIQSYTVDRNIFVVVVEKTAFTLTLWKKDACFYVVPPEANTVTDTFNSINVCGKSKTEQSKPIQPIILVGERF